MADTSWFNQDRDIEPLFWSFELETESLLSQLQDVESLDDYYFDFWTPSAAKHYLGLDCLVR